MLLKSNRFIVKKTSYRYLLTSS